MSPQISTVEQQSQWKAMGMEIDPVTGMPFGTVLRNGEGKLALVTKEGLLPLTEAQAKEIVEGFSRGGKV
jgi:hypothetical protein